MTRTFPRRLRFVVAKDARLATTILGIGHRALASFYRRSAKEDGFSATRTAAVTFVLRFSSRSRNLRFYAVIPDGVLALRALDEPGRATFGATE